MHVSSVHYDILKDVGTHMNMLINVYIIIIVTNSTETQTHIYNPKEILHVCVNMYVVTYKQYKINAA